MTKPRIHLAWLIIPCLAADGLMMPMLTSLSGPPHDIIVPLALGIVGCVLAQGCLLAAWVAWGDGPFLRRLEAHWIVSAGLYLVWLMGFGLASVLTGRIPPQIAATVALGVPLVSLAAQFPLWVTRQLFGWRLVREEADVEQNRKQRLSIRDLMLATLVAAVTLALARLAPSPDAGEMWPVWGVLSTVACVISTISLLPAGVLLLRQRPLRRSLVWSSLYALSLISLIWVAVVIQYQFALAPLAPRAIYIGLSSLMFTFASTLTLAAAIARDRGYRLARRRPPLPLGEGRGKGIRE